MSIFHISSDFLKCNIRTKLHAGVDCGRFPTWQPKAAQAEKQSGRKDDYRKTLLAHLYSKTKPNFRVVFMPQISTNLHKGFVFVQRRKPDKRFCFE
jgi:hypothetical protein